jgi:cytochrome c5
MKQITSVRNILRVAAVIVAVTAVPAFAEADMAKYGKSCAMCHESGAAGAPKTGDVKAWEPRLAKGMDVLMESVKNGLNAMPPTGLCSDCTNEEYQALINYMASGES